MFLQIFIQNVILWPFLTVFALKVSDDSFFDFWDLDSNLDSCKSFSISAKDSLGFESQIKGFVSPLVFRLGGSERQALDSGRPNRVFAKPRTPKSI
jgi:hypothetical protein